MPPLSQPIRKPVTYQEVFGQPHTAQGLRALTESLPRAEASRFLAALGVHLHMMEDAQDFTAPLPAFLGPQPIVDRVLRICRREGDRQWLHAGTVCAGWRALALWGSKRSRAVTEPFLPDFTRWIFHLSDAYADRQIDFLTDATGQACYSPVRMFAFTLQNEWIHGKTQDYYTIARTYWLLHRIPPLLRPQDRKLDIARVFEEVLGFGLEEYRAVGTVLWGWCYPSRVRSLSPPDAANAGVVEVPRHFAITALDSALVESVVNALAQDLDELRDACDGSHFHEAWWSGDFLQLARTPLIETDCEGYFALSLPALVLDAFSGGVYHRLRDYYSEKEGTGNNTFTTYWGNLVEAYTGKLLEDTFRAIEERDRRRRVWIPSHPDMRGHERCDGVVRYNKCAVVFESTSSHFTVKSLTGHDLDEVERDLEKVVFSKVRQLSRACEDLAVGKTTLLEDGRPIRVTEFIPVLITLAPVPVWQWLMQLVDEVCEREGLFSGVSCTPVQIISMEEFEMLLDLAAARKSLPHLLRRRASSAGGRDQSMKNWLYTQKITLNAERRSPLLQEAFREWGKEVMGMLKGESP